MKTKNILRAFLMAVFALGTLAIHAQTKLYVHKAFGMSDEYNIADIDSISIIPPPILEVSPSNVSFTGYGTPVTAGGNVFTVNTNVEYAIAGPEWISVKDKTAGGFTLIAKPNDTGGVRTGQVTVSAAGVPDITINLSQDPASGDFENVTALSGLKNTILPFEHEGDWHLIDGNASDYTYLIADWNTNAEMRANGNIYNNYGYSKACLHHCLYIGNGINPYNSFSMTNGKLWQTVELQAGTYSFDVYLVSSNNSNKVYLAAAEGDQLPDFINVPTPASLGYVAIPSITFTDTDDINNCPKYSATFTLTETTTVSLGFVANYNEVVSMGVWEVRLTWKPLAHYEEITASAGLKNTHVPFSYGNFVYHQMCLINDWEYNQEAINNGNVDRRTEQLCFFACNLYGLSTPSRTITNGKLYQTVELDAGTYRFDVYCGDIDSDPDSPVLDVYIGAAIGGVLPDVQNLSTALKFTRITGKGMFSISFNLPDHESVSLGFIANLNNAASIYGFKAFDRVELWKITFE